MRNVFVAMSGGVDSGVAASLILERGDHARGVYMRHRRQRTFDAEETRSVLESWRGKASLEVYSVDAQGALQKLEQSPDSFPFLLPADAAAALETCAFLNMPLILLDVDRPFEQIVENFVGEYYAAHTPNPCVLCNRRVKFGLLWDVARELGAERLATGHYVQKRKTSDWLAELKTSQTAQIYEGTNFADPPEWLTRDPDALFLTRSPSRKDQTYFLYDVDSRVLPYVEFAVGALEKEDARRIAVEKNLPVAARKESQEVCFVPDKGKLEFIRAYRETRPERWDSWAQDTSGAFCDLDGKVIGRHGGYEKYTVGQRKGLGVGFGERIFVQKIDPATRSVYLGPYENLAVDTISFVDSNWSVAPPVEKEFRCEIKARYRNEPCMATVYLNRDGSGVAKADVPRYGIAPGQALVCYWGDRLLGGGRIV